MNINNTVFLTIIIVELLLIVVFVIVFAVQLKKLKEVPKKRNEVDEELEKELKNSSEL